MKRRLALSQRKTRARTQPLHSTFEGMGMAGALRELRASLLAALAPTDRARLADAVPAWVAALGYARAVSACRLDPDGAFVALCAIRRAHDALGPHAPRRVVRAPSPPLASRPRVPAKRLAAMVRLEWGALLEVHAAQLALRAFGADDAPPRGLAAPPAPQQHAAGSEGAAVASLWHHAYCAAVWTSAHAEYLATLDELVTGASVVADEDAKDEAPAGAGANSATAADGSARAPANDPRSEAELVDALLVPPPELFTVPNLSNAAQLAGLFERPTLPKTSARAAHIMHALLVRCCNAGTRGWEATLASATNKDVDGVVRVCMHALGVALAGMHPALHPAVRPPWGERLAVTRLWRMQLHRDEFKEVALGAPTVLKEVLRLHLAAVLHEDAATLEALRATGQTAGQLLLPPRSLPATPFLSAMHRLVELGAEMAAPSAAPAAPQSLAKRLRATLACTARTGRRVVSDDSVLAYNTAWLGGRASAPSPASSTVSVVSGLLSATFRSRFVPLWIHGQSHKHRASRLDETQFAAVHEHNPAYKLLAVVPQPVFDRTLRLVLRTRDADLVTVHETLKLLGIRQPDNEPVGGGGGRTKRARARGAGAGAGAGASDDGPAPPDARAAAEATYAEGLPSPSASRVVQDAERAILRLEAKDAAAVLVFARFCALRAQLLSFDLGEQTRFRQARAVCLRMGVLPDLSAGETYESVTRTRLPKHASTVFVCAECRRIANAVQDYTGKRIAFNEIGLSASMLQVSADGDHMRCAKRSSAALRTAMQLESMACASQIEELPLLECKRLPQDLRPASVVVAMCNCAPKAHKRAKRPPREVDDDDAAGPGVEPASEVAKLRRDIKNSLEQDKLTSACGDAPLVQVNVLGRVVRVFGEWVSLCSLCGCLCTVTPASRFGGEIYCGRCDFAIIFGKEAQEAVDALMPKPVQKSCRFCGKLQPASATGRWKTVHAPMDCGGKNANVPPPLRTVTYCPAHMKSWLVTAHRTMTTQVIFSHLLSKAKPIFGADKTSAGRSGQASSSTAGPAPPPKKRSAGDRRKDQLAKRITLSNKRRAQSC